mmetsp:Transcript_21017/g.26011  ORF Transcript_21017/g.26011 Transcript_21017/m.26011 type:complete len:136 (-) Transcript_21017:61-468(-)
MVRMLTCHCWMILVLAVFSLMFLQCYSWAILLLYGWSFDGNRPRTWDLVCNDISLVLFELYVVAADIWSREQQLPVGDGSRINRSLDFKINISIQRHNTQTRLQAQQFFSLYFFDSFLDSSVGRSAALSSKDVDY